MSKPSQVIVVVEDSRHERVLYRYLKERGLGVHAVRIEVSPSGEGSAESWVRKRFVTEVSVYRSRHSQTALIVVIDADRGLVQDRLTQLDQELKNNEKPIVAAHERIARLVPRRNIETWILCLNERAVYEETDYKGTENEKHWSTMIPPAAKNLSEWTTSQAEPPNTCINSLRLGVKELKRLRL